MNLALNGTDPVCFFEPETVRHRQAVPRGRVPEGYYELKEGDLDVIKEGRISPSSPWAPPCTGLWTPSKRLEGKYGPVLRVMNICSVVPLSYDQIIASVKKTGKVLLASDACSEAPL